MEEYKISDVLADATHPAHEATTKMMDDLRSGKISMCACMGPGYGEPYCPCEMSRRGLDEQMKNNPLRIEANKRSAEMWKKFMDEGGFGQFESEE
jgi:hypothetical protein